MRHFFRKMNNSSFTTFKESHFAQKMLKSMNRDKMATLPYLTSPWVLWKSCYTFWLKKCLRPCLAPSMYLSERIDWIISSFPRWISNILFVFGSWDHFGSLGCRIGECPFFYVSILFLGSVISNCLSERIFPYIS